jgi:hypothetical protein
MRALYPADECLQFGHPMSNKSVVMTGKTTCIRFIPEVCYFDVSSSVLVIFFCTGCSAYLYQLFPPVYNLSFVGYSWCAQRDAHASVG